MTKSALLLVDIQNDYFPGGRWELDDMDAAAANAARLLADARASGQKVIHIRHEFPTQDAPFFRPGSPGAHTHTTVAPQGDEPVILKHFPSGFRETELKEMLDGEGITDLTICGAMSQMCITSTARAAADLGYTVTVVHDACAAPGQSFNETEVPASHVHAVAMGALEGFFAEVTTTDKVLG